MSKSIIVLLLIANLLGVSSCRGSEPGDGEQAPAAPSARPAASAQPAAPAKPAASQPCEWDGVDSIVAVGDVHGDYGQFVKILRLAGVIDEKENWIAGKAHLVQVGDVAGRGAGTRAAMDLLMKLQGQSAKVGGAVHPLIGNHEAMIVLGDWRYMTDAEKDAFGGEEKLKDELGNDGKYGKWIRSNNTVIRINDVLFVHAGLTPVVAARYKTLAQINDAIRDELRRGDEDGLANSELGPLWTRGFAMAARWPEQDDAEILPVVRKFSAQRMVVGHTITSDGIHAGLNDRLIMIDVGMSAFAGNPAACLVIEKGEFFSIQDGQPKRKLFDAQPAQTRPEELRPAS